MLGCLRLRCESAYKLTEPSNDNLDRLKTMWFQMVGNFLGVYQTMYHWYTDLYEDVLNIENHLTARHYVGN